jgi:uncharacterized protein (DUF302 family)
MKQLIVVGGLLALAGCATQMQAAAPAAAAPGNGLTTVKSAHAPKATMDRFESAVKAKNMNVFARVDHAAGAQRIGKTLRPTEALIWGSPPGGTPIMECAQTAGIDLPQRTLVWQDDKGDTYLAYNDPGYLVARHGGAGKCDGVVTNVRAALAGFAAEATKP